MYLDSNRNSSEFHFYKKDNMWFYQKSMPRTIKTMNLHEMEMYYWSFKPIVSNAAERIFHINPQLRFKTFRYDKRDVCTICMYIQKCKKLNDEIFVFIYWDIQNMIGIHCKYESYSHFYKKWIKQPFERIQRLNYWRVFDIWIIVVQEKGGFFDPYSLLFNHTCIFC